MNPRLEDISRFSYQYETENSSGNLYVMDTEAQRTQVEIHGSPADLYLSDDPESSNTIIWMDQKTGALIEVTAFLGGGRPALPGGNGHRGEFRNRAGANSGTSGIRLVQ